MRSSATSLGAAHPCPGPGVISSFFETYLLSNVHIVLHVTFLVLNKSYLLSQILKGPREMTLMK